MTQDQNQTTASMADPQSGATPTPTNPFPPAVANPVPAESLAVPAAQVSPETELALVPELSTELAAVPAPDLSAEIVTAEPVTMAVNADSAVEPVIIVASTEPAAEVTLESTPVLEPTQDFTSLPAEVAQTPELTQDAQVSLATVPAESPATEPASATFTETELEAAPALELAQNLDNAPASQPAEPVAAAAVPAQDAANAAPVEEADAAATLNEPVDFATQKQQLEAEIAESKAQLEALDKFEKAIFVAEEQINREKEAAQIAALEAEIAA